MKSFITILFVAAVVVLGIMLGRGTPKPSSSPLPPITFQDNSTSSPSQIVTTNPTPTPIDSPSNPAQGGSGPTGHLFVLSQSGAKNEIYAIDVVTKDKKTIFTDKDDESKIKDASEVTKAGDSIVVLLASDIDPAGQLVAIKTDGSGNKSVLANSFVSPSAPAVSPDQSKIALVRFSNAEPNFGFTLTLMNVDGSDKKDLAKDQSGIAHLAFSPDGKQIAFVKGAAASSSEVDVVTITTGKIETLYDAKDKIIEDFDWSAVGPLIITAVQTDKKASKVSEVYIIDTKTKGTIQVTKNGKSERSPKMAPDASGIAYLQFKDSKSTTGDVIVAFPDGSNPITLGTGNQLLGWIR